MSDMKKRFTLYGFGFFIGIILVFFFLGGKQASCNWLPNDRMLNIIRQKKIEYSDAVAQQVINNTKDSLIINEILTKGDIDFSKSQVKNEPCRYYIIDGTGTAKDHTISVELCDSIATIKTLQKNK